MSEVTKIPSDIRSLFSEKRRGSIMDAFSNLPDSHKLFADGKRILGLDDCPARDFSAQIAHISLVMIRYNLPASIKRFHDYETIGGIFADIYDGVHELTVVEKIWGIILEVVAVIAVLTSADPEELIRQIIENDKRLAALQKYAQTA